MPLPLPGGAKKRRNGFRSAAGVPVGSASYATSEKSTSPRRPFEEATESSACSMRQYVVGQTLDETSSTMMPTAFAGRKRRPGFVGAATNAVASSATRTSASASRTTWVRRATRSRKLASATGIGVSSARAIRPHGRCELFDRRPCRAPGRPGEPLRLRGVRLGASPPQLDGEALERLAALVRLPAPRGVLSQAQRTLDRAQVRRDAQHAQRPTVCKRDRAREDAGAEDAEDCEQNGK